MNHRIKKLSLLFLFAFLLIVIVFFLFRNKLLYHFVEKKIQQTEQKLKVKITIKNVSFNGLSGIKFEQLCIAPSQKDTFFLLGQVSCKIRIFPLLMGNLRLSKLEVKHVKAHLVKKWNRDNISFFLNRNSKKSIQNSSLKREYNTWVENILNTFFDIIPSSVDVESCQFFLETDSSNIGISMPEMSIKDNVFESEINFLESNRSQAWKLKGKLNAEDKNVQVKVYHTEKNPLIIPLIKKRYNLNIGFDTLEFILASVQTEKNEIKLRGNFCTENLILNHWRISPSNVTIQKQKFDFDIHVGRNYIELDSSSRVAYNKVVYHPYLRYTASSEPTVRFDISLPEHKAQDFFESLPSGLFGNIEGIKTSGKVFYKLHFSLNLKKPDDIEFKSYLGKKDFKIQAFGKTNLAKINEEFDYSAYDKEKFVRTIIVGPKNPYYTPLEEISDWLKASVLTSEDGNFFSHLGFNEEAFTRSIATNFKKKRFVRGGSTISMQLVKNVFLTRNKTVARKIEEAMIVWLIENNRIVSKERMLEVYLNIIEWGPGVYGIGEASQFYFNKTPSHLTLSESIFLAMIIPRPKWFANNFGSYGKFKTFVLDYYALIANHLLKHGKITEAERIAIIPEIELVGRAKENILKNDSISKVIQPSEDLIFEEQ